MADRQHPSSKTRPPITIWQGALTLGSVAVLAALFVAVFNFAGSVHPAVSKVPTGTATKQETPSVGVTTTTIPTVAGPHLPGWQSAGPPYADTIVFSPSNPTTGYACGEALPSTQTAQLREAGLPGSTGPGPTPLPEGRLPLGVTHDGGATWQTLITPNTGNMCAVMLNPTNPLDVMMPNAASSARSLDGGQTWHTFTQPQNSRDLVWMGSTIFVAIQGTDTNNLPTGPITLMKSVADEPFTLVPSVHLMLGIPAGANFTHMFTVGAALDLQFSWYVPGPGVRYGSTVASSRDGGITWSYRQPIYQGIPVGLVTSTPDGATLLGYDIVPDGPQLPNTPQVLSILISHDGGATWSALPSPPNQECGNMRVDPSGPVITPDGTIFATCHDLPPVLSYTLYSLDAGASAWQVRSPSMSGLQMVLAVDAAGHPTAVWGHAGTTTSDPFAHRIFGLQELVVNR